MLEHGLWGSRPAVVAARGLSGMWGVRLVALPPPRDLSRPGIEPVSPALASRFFTVPSGAHRPAPCWDRGRSEVSAAPGVTGKGLMDSGTS